MSDYYNRSSVPAQGAAGSSSAIRAEFDAIQTGLSDKLAPLTGNGGKIVGINVGATAQEAIATTGTGNLVRATSPALTTPTGIVKGDVGLGNVDNTSDVNKPVSTAQAAADVLATAANIHAAAIKATPVDADELGIADSAASFALKRITIAQVKALAQSQPFRNRVINSAFTADQRNSGGSQTIVAGAALAYGVDRFYLYCTGANLSASSNIDPLAYAISGAASNTGFGLGHRIEQRNSVDLAGNTCTLSLKTSVPSGITLNWAVYYAASANTFGTVASPTRTLISSGTFTITGTEATYSAQMAVPAGATTGIEIVFTVASLVSGKLLTFRDIQFEKGAIALADIVPEVVEVTTNLLRCQRYYARTTLSARFTATGAGQFSDVGFYLPVAMRIVPAQTYISGRTTALANESVIGLGVQSGRFSITSTGVGDCYSVDGINAFDAELKT